MLLARKNLFKHPWEFALKGQDLSTRSPSGVISAAGDVVESAERRNSHRFTLSASAELVEPRTNTQLAGRASDLSTGGCYVDTMTPFPVGTSVDLNLRSENHAIRAKASVIYAHTGMGMGLAFTEMDPDQRKSLSAWLAELADEHSDPRSRDTAPGYVHANNRRQKPAASIKNPALIEAMQELVSLLRNKGVLTETEAELLREKVEQ
jgi:hypothetical protein